MGIAGAAWLLLVLPLMEASSCSGLEGECEAVDAAGGQALFQVRRSRAQGDEIALEEVDAAAAEETTSDDSFEAARPGSCCYIDAHTRVAWSEFAAGEEVAANISSGLPVVVPCGHEVTMDGPVAGLHGLQVLGSMTFRDGIDIVLETGYIFVCGRFNIGSSMNPHNSKVEIVLTGNTDMLWPTSSGVKNFGKAPFVTYGGAIYIQGSACGTTTWTRLGATVAPVASHNANVARGQDAQQSSIGHSRYTAAKGVDGSSSWKWGSMLTRREMNPWWSVRIDSLSSTSVGRVALTKRSRWGSDLSKATVGVTNSPCQRGALCGGTICQYVETDRLVSDFDCGGAKGLYVYVQLPGTNTLSMAEAEVFLASSGATYELQLQDAAQVAWKAGDRLMITATGFDALETEEVTVVAASPGRVTVTGQLRYPHGGCSASEQCIVAAEVASLNRNIVIRGRDSCDPTCGHFMIAHTHHGFVCGAEFTNLGQTAVEGRYPLHIHLPGESPQLIVKDNALHHNINRGLVMHGVHKMRVESNLCYKTKGHCFMTEDGVEQHNQVLRNLGVLVSSLHFGCSQSHDMTFRCAHRSDHSPNAFWISNPNNLLDGNVAVVTGGAYFIEMRHVMGLVRRKFGSEAMKVGSGGKIKGSVPLLQFSNNMAHSSGGGIGNYPRLGLRPGGRNAYENFTAWRCGGGIAVHTGGFRMPIREARLFENTVAVTAGHPSNHIAIYQSKMTARPGFVSWNKGTKYVSAPLIMNRFGKTRASYFPRIFTVDSQTRNWVRCHGGYDRGTLAYQGWRGDWFAMFTDPAYTRPCPPALLSLAHGDEAEGDAPDKSKHLLNDPWGWALRDEGVLEGKYGEDGAEVEETEEYLDDEDVGEDEANLNNYASGWYEEYLADEDVGEDEEDYMEEEYMKENEDQKRRP